MAAAPDDPDFSALLDGPAPEADFDLGAGDLDMAEDDLGELGMGSDDPELGSADDLAMGMWEAIKADDFEAFRDALDAYTAMSAAKGAAGGGLPPL